MQYDWTPLSEFNRLFRFELQRLSQHNVRLILQLYYGGREPCLARRLRLTMLPYDKWRVSLAVPELKCRSIGDFIVRQIFLVAIEACIGLMPPHGDPREEWIYTAGPLFQEVRSPRLIIRRLKKMAGLS